MRDEMNNSSFQTKFGGFEKLMPYRVRNILMVASLYDSFLLADDERLNEALFGDRLTGALMAPKITRVGTAEEALKALSEEPYDIVITMIQVGETDMSAFFRNIKDFKPELPAVLLAFNIQDVRVIPEDVRALSDGIFLWNGDTRIFSTIINVIEDSKNIEEDSKVGVQVVLLVEDNIKFYSSYLPVMYTELIKQTNIVMAEELNPVKKNLRLKARPKVLFCNDYETAWNFYEKYKNNILGVITDIEYPRNGKLDSTAGIDLTRIIKRENPDMPVLLQSSDPSYVDTASSLGAAFMNKNSPDLSKKLRAFIMRYFGFGDFIFSNQQGHEIARASDLQSMVRLLRQVPTDSIMYHAVRNHFSKWLLARTEFEIAYRIRPLKTSEFDESPEKIRKYLIETLYRFIHKNQFGTILKFDRKFFEHSTPFVKIGNGAIGGKARGLAFEDYLLSRNMLEKSWENVNVNVPNTIVIATDVFDFFIEQNKIEQLWSENMTDEQTVQLFQKSNLPDYLLEDLKVIADRVSGPIAIRSSSLLEDSKTQPFAGVYKTYMLANNSEDKNIRLEGIIKAIKYVYASVFSKEAVSYRKLNPFVSDEEKMAVIIQRVVGRQMPSGYFYPMCAGVMQSYNYYPVPPLKAEEPITHIGIGLGEKIVEGSSALRFSPAHPQNIHQFATLKDFFSSSQKEFYALDMKNNGDELTFETAPAIKNVPVQTAEEDGILDLTGSTYCFEEERVYDGIKRPGPHLVTFAPILKHEEIPISDILLSLSEMGKKAMGMHVEMEFACDHNPETGKTDFYILQIRPMASRVALKKISLDDIPREKILFMSKKALGNGIKSDIKDLIYVIPEAFDILKTRDIAQEIDAINNRLRAQNKHYAILGPGRWGSSDASLGIPVKWNEISNSSIIVEAAYGDFIVEPSYGSHFFHNVTSLGLGYITIHDENESSFVNWKLLKSFKPVEEMKYIRHLRFDDALDVKIDGNDGRAAVALS